MTEKRIVGLPHTAEDLERSARLLRHLNETELLGNLDGGIDEDTDLGFRGEVEYWWADQLLGVVKHDGLEWFYVPMVEIKAEGESNEQ